ncbi:MAG TPA: aminodeoxychorismate lyase [Steroidobacteraceae bacterium]|jgi:4-amino-4-deoxychorismate lyase|nr:aminodeoxychorismate lyase [Steroidobacteraceae bacterium]
MSTTLINGQPGEQVAALERALQYGDGLFETISCCEGRARWLERHLSRLREGCRRLQLCFEQESALAAEVSQLAQGQVRCLIKVIVSRGVSTRRGYRPSGEERATRIVSRHEWPQDGTEQRPLRVGLSAVALGINPRLAGLKHLNRLEQVLAQLDKPVALDEVLMAASSGELVSGSMSNVFLVDERGLFTPSVEQCGVAGVMRARVLDALAARAHRDLSAEIRTLAAGELGRVGEAFLTNVRWGIRSIGVLDGRNLPSDDYAQRLRRLIDALDV